MRKKRKTIVSAVLVASMFVGASMSSMAAEYQSVSPETEISTYAIEDADSGQGDWVWSKSKQKWWFKTSSSGDYLADGIYTISGKDYAFDKDGWMVKGWYWYDGDWYYFKDDGVMVTGWFQQSGKWYYLDKAYGYMYSYDAYNINNQIYVFDKSGVMLSGKGWRSMVINGKRLWFYLNSDGSCKTGWIKDSSKWYYLSESAGFMYFGDIYEIDGKVYAFDNSGAMKNGWYKYEGIWYYFKNDGSMHYGWLQLGKTWYYLDEYYGDMYCDGNYMVGNTISGFDKNGAWLGYLKKDGTGYYK